MNDKYDLSIVVITMNRREQLLEALESCLYSKLPEKTEFIIIDNHSTDNTGEVVESFKQKHPEIEVNYQYKTKNLGVGGGRAAGFELAKAEYLYFLDDDAIIAEECRKDFFVKTLAYMERNKTVASVTTRIKDIMLKYDRGVGGGKREIEGLPVVFKFLGGSHFLRKEAFSNPLYFSIEYGSEEYAPSIMVQDKGWSHVYDKSIYIIHKPKVNKWLAGTASMEKIQCCGCAVTYATKKLLYPKVFHPLLFLAYRIRCFKYLRPYKGAMKKSDRMVRQIEKENPCTRIRFSTVIRLYREFGSTIF